MIRYGSSKVSRGNAFSWELFKILSIRVEEVPVILVGKLIWGVKLFEKTDSKNSKVPIFLA